jgi:hypothetical protein
LRSPALAGHAREAAPAWIEGTCRMAGPQELRSMILQAI